jgi:uncharacterized protein YegL
MKDDYTHIAVILDRTGSMETIRDDTIGGFNVFLDEQKKEPATATLTLVQFDTEDPYEVIHDFKPIADIPPLTRKIFVPRGGTPLLDAMGRGINDLEKHIGDLREEERPAKVIVAVVTDGQENSSEEFNRETIEKMVKERTEKDGWPFVFLSADLAAIEDAKSVGIDPAGMFAFAKNKVGTRSMWSTLSRTTSGYRAAPKRKIGFGSTHVHSRVRPLTRPLTGQVLQ